MGSRFSFLLLILVAFCSNYATSTEFVPVYMWGTEKMSEHVPALHKISQDSFKDTILEYLEKGPYVIVFTERTLSPEDFAQRNQKGESAFKNLQELKNEGNFVSYRPYVQNPMGALKQVNKPLTQMSIESILSSVKVPKENIWVINLDDAKDDESRFHMLKRHDSDIALIYQDILKQHDNVLAMYTANHTAWVAPEDITHTKSRNLLAEEDKEKPTPQTFTGEKMLLYLTDEGVYSVTTGNNEPEKIPVNNKTFTLEALNKTTYIVANISSEKLSVTLNITSRAGYWYIKNIEAAQKDTDPVILTNSSGFYAPMKFSYHCGKFNMTVKGKDNKRISLVLPGFQIQAFLANNSGFGDAYDCVGFTSVPIWSGLFVTALLLLIVTFGLTMMMDIKTMDRFDDPKGKTITVTASE